MYQLYPVDFKATKREMLHEAYSELTLINAMTWNRSMNILQNLHFTDNQTADKSDKVIRCIFS